ncbi:hypothetical protein EXIGLDRAFT_762060 [Exidia glandulosa HHB12029]|uniref:DUF6533 domain-containing protein n=1 Tax=Exidia glandulosa HHB12029 TaxID=1314781 RepID=A0A165MYU4_EXIGL|nr:hypothetical protein EXIGLDRAFT_762060 [Exidia glandulosa HHB12029]
MDSAHYAPSTVQHFNELQGWKYYFMATYTVLVYDWLTTLDIEVERIWMRKRTFFTVLWALIRYLPILMFLSATYYHLGTGEVRCHGLATLPTIFVIILLLIAHLIFLLRTYALYGRARIVVYVFVPALVIEAGVLTWTAFDERITTLPKGYGCIPGSPRRVQGIVTWTAPFIFDCMIFTFTLVKSLKFLRENQDVPIVHVVLRDGLVYFALMFVSYSLNMFMYIFAPLGLQDINAGFSTTITVISTCRLILNLRAATPGQAGPEDLPSRSHMSFLSKPSELVSTFLTEIGGVLESQVERRQHYQEYPLQDINDRQPPHRRQGRNNF